MKRKTPEDVKQEEEPKDSEKEAKQEVGEYNICYFKAADGSVAAVDTTDALQKSMSDLFRFMNDQYPSEKEKMDNPVKSRLPTAVDITRSMGFLSLFHEERNIVDKDIPLLDNAINFAVQTMCNRVFVSDLRGAIDRWLLKNGKGKRDGLVLGAMSAWTRLSDPTLPENAGIQVSISGLSEYTTGWLNLSDSERDIVRNFSFLVRPNFLRNENKSFLGKEDEKLVGSTLLNPDLWSPPVSSLSRMCFEGEWVSHLVSKGKIKMSSQGWSVEVSILKKESAREDLDDLLSWINKDAVLVFGNSSINVHRKGAISLRIVLVPDFDDLDNHESIDECCIRFVDDKPTVFRSDACLVSHQRKATVGVDAVLVPITAVRGVAVYDEQMRRFDEKKLDRLRLTSPVFKSALDGLADFAPNSTVGKVWGCKGKDTSIMSVAHALEILPGLEAGEEEDYAKEWKGLCGSITEDASGKLEQAVLDCFEQSPFE
jgi:hypothetical protein